jgi:iron complex outermembrane receptor protein
LEKAPEQLNKVDPTTLKPVNVTAIRANHDVTDPYNQDYVLPNAFAGTKTDTSIMETPLNVQVISKQVLKDQQVINLGDALKNVSGVTVLGNAGDVAFDGGVAQSIVLRGFESQFFFRNGFRLQQNSASRSMANVESVEVLKGPAAILYGMVEPGGMVNLVTKQPLSNPYYSVNQQFGSYDLYRTTADIGGPVGSNKDLLYRLNVSYENSNSFRQFVDKEDVFIAPVLKWNISPKTSATLEFEYNHKNFGYDSGILPIYNGKAMSIPRSLNYGEYSPGVTETAYGGFTLAHQFNDDWSVKQRFSVNQQNNALPNLLLQGGFLNTGDGNINRFGIGFGTQYNTYSDNIDLTGHFNTFGLKHTLLLGGDFYHLNTIASQSYSLDPSGIIPSGFITSPINILNPVHTGTSFLPLTQALLNLTDTDQYGAYIQDQIQLPYNLHVLGGIRYQNLHQSISDGLNIGSDPSKQTQDAVTPRVGVLWRTRPWLSLYANYVESFGANTGIMYPNKIVPGTSAEQYEGGIKTEFFDGKLRTNLAYYDLTKTNIASSDPRCAGNPSCAYVVATGAARSKGPELDITGEVLPGWNMIATYAYTDVRAIKSNADNEATHYGAVPVGARFYNVPRNTASFWNTYEFLESDLKGLKFGGGVTLRDGQTGCCDVPAGKVAGYATMDLLVSYSLKVGKTKVTTQFNINNLLDKHYYTGLLSSGINTSGYTSAIAEFGAPRTFMGSINVQF